MSMTLITKPQFTLDLRGVSQEHRDLLNGVFDDLSRSMSGVMSAARKWVRLPEDVREKVREGAPEMWKRFLTKLQRVGEGTLHPQLYALSGTAASTLGKLPVNEQEKWLTERIPVALADGDTRRVDVSEMTAEQRRQVFGRDENGEFFVRNLAQQRGWQADEAKAKNAKQAAAKMAGAVITRAGRWRVEAGRLWLDAALFKEGMTRAHLVAMLKDLER